MGVGVQGLGFRPTVSKPFGIQKPSCLATTFCFNPSDVCACMMSGLEPWVCGSGFWGMCVRFLEEVAVGRRTQKCQETSERKI